ncbi:hypothetical protein HQQ94_14930 [Shewanella sp. VB17]|uniref:hypothetical protein n=1 Tax=Shewanella sp. VB17 TaxID=2739432 RepID=UPI0015636E2E|nr:hypothetical protein [Shewanella sp. VB17]NRD74507.1 hypothetical protein [Shewanella sp. VB17]
MEFSVEECDIAMLKRLLVIRADREDKLRRQLVQSQHASHLLVQEQHHVRAERYELVAKLTHQAVPQVSLSPDEVVKFKLSLAKGYQQERALAESLVTLQNEADELALTQAELRVNIVRLSKNQQKLQAVFNESSITDR